MYMCVCVCVCILYFDAAGWKQKKSGWPPSLISQAQHIPLHLPPFQLPLSGISYLRITSSDYVIPSSSLKLSSIFFTYCCIVVSSSVVFVFFLLFLKFYLWRVKIFVQGFSSMDPFFQLLPLYVSAVSSFSETRVWLCMCPSFLHLFPRFSSSVLLPIKPGILCWNFWQIFSRLFLYINVTVDQDTRVCKQISSD
jgi:hypothetical protein